MSAPSPSTPTYVNSTPSYFGGNGAITFSVRTTLIYIGGSLGVLALVIVMLMVVLVLCVRPNRRRRELYLAMQRQREAAVQEVKTEVDTFKPQLRSFPIVVLQPDSTEIACGHKLSLDGGHNFPPAKSTGSSGDLDSALSDITEESSQSSGSGRGSPREPLPAEAFAPSTSAAPTPDASSAGSSGHGEGSSRPQPNQSTEGVTTAEEAPLIYNPLTHYMTERQPHLFIADVMR